MLDLQKFKNSRGQIWLNVASSVYVLDDFINLDNHIFIRFISQYGLAKKILPAKYHGLLTEYYNAGKKARLVKHDCRKPMKLPDGSVDHILCSHFLEHVFPEDRRNILSDFYRVLKTGGSLHIILPDIELQVKNYLRKKEMGVPTAADEFITESLLSKDSRGTLRYRLMEFSGGFGLQHRWMYDKDSISHFVKQAGFEIIENNESNPSHNFRLNDDSIHVVCRKS